MRAMQKMLVVTFVSIEQNNNSRNKGGYASEIVQIMIKLKYILYYTYIALQKLIKIKKL